MIIRRTGTIYITYKGDPGHHHYTSLGEFVRTCGFPQLLMKCLLWRHSPAKDKVQTLKLVFIVLYNFSYDLFLLLAYKNSCSDQIAIFTIGQTFYFLTSIFLFSPI